LNCKKPGDFVNPLLARKSIAPQQWRDFQAALQHYKKEVDHQHFTRQSEPNIVTNALKPFIDALGYKTNSYSQKGHSGIDLAILDNGHPAVIFEVKKSGSDEMVTCDRPNSKALHEAVLYFMRERAKGKQGIFTIVITDFYSWFVIDARDFDRLFWRDSTVNKLFHAHQDHALLGDTTAEFYAELGKEIDKMAKDLFEGESMDCAVFHIDQLKTDRDLIAVCKLLSPDCLLKAFNPNDANSLNKDFYGELLYIVGLEEATAGGTKVIQRARLQQPGTLFENILEKLERHGKRCGFEDVMALIILWVNRVLFLKLLESQIIKWTADKSKKFLSEERIRSYGRLDELFFSVLAKPVSARSSAEFDFIPYLNSSLFEMHQAEKDGITIASLSNEAQVNYFSRTILKDDRLARKTGTVNTLAYFFAFLDAYDFGSEGYADIAAENKPLINAAVLGLIFEKINGYQDGSFYTPSAVTTYMSREAVRKVILDRFNTAFDGLDATSWVELRRYCENNSHKQHFIDRATPLIDQLTICDPAVGSGHFLVSVLNELILSKYELGLFQIKGMRIDLVNDELLIRLDEEWFEYRQPDSLESPNHVLQKRVFEEKQRIIENQLFGVDINHNSAQITRLRLWIELLKFSHYDGDGQLVTLPNIDINIKTGNSLVSRFGLADQIDNQDMKAQIVSYKEKVRNYKENLGSKRDVWQAISAIKDEFGRALKSGHKSSRILLQKLVDYYRIFGAEGLNKELRTLVLDVTQGQNDLFGFDPALAKMNLSKRPKMLDDLKKLHAQFAELDAGEIYDDAFEWRFEFPEVLDEAGEFLGFDLMIGNPPYGLKSPPAVRTHLIATISKVPDFEIYYWFIDRSYQLLAKNGLMALIVPNSLLFNVNAREYRRALIGRVGFYEVLDCSAFSLFSDATVRNIILFAAKNKTAAFGFRQTSGVDAFSKLIQAPRVYTDDVAVLEMNQNWGLVFALAPEVIATVLRIRSVSTPLAEFFPQFSQGLIAYDAVQGQDAHTIKNRVYHARAKKDGTYKCWINGADVTRYAVRWNGMDYISYGDWIANPRKPAFFTGPRLLIREITNPRIYCAYAEDELYNDPAVIIVKDHPEGPVSLFALLGILNSRLATFYHFKASPKATKGAFPKILVGDIAAFPIPAKADAVALAEIAALAKQRCAPGAADAHAMTGIDTQIDALVYKLYACTDEEVGMIEASFGGVATIAAQSTAH
ncbi:MAG: TaqI-like C-terminal specificity domain-containing protein, partial [Telluria sp.]